MNKKILVLLSLVVLVVLSTNVLGMGLSPSFFYLDEMIRGNTYEKNFRALNLDGSSANITLGATGGAQDWISFYDLETNEEIKTIFVPAKSDVPFRVEFKVPADAPNGVYEGYLTITPDVDSELENPVSIVTRNLYQLQVSGTEKIAGTVDGISAPDTESGQLLRIQYGFRNTGNVGATPTAKLIVSKGGEVIDSVEVEGTYVKRATFFNQEFTWDTENRGTGDFSANVEIVLDGKTIAKEDIPFNLAPRGTYTADGLVGEVVKPSHVTVNSVAKTQIQFFNKGQIDVKAKVVAEVTKNGKVIDVIQGDEFAINAGDSDNLYFYFKPSQEGNYEITPKVIYGGKEKALDAFTVEVKSEDDGLTSGDLNSGSNSLMVVLIALVGVLIIVVAVFGYFHFKKLY